VTIWFRQVTLMAVLALAGCAEFLVERSPAGDLALYPPDVDQAGGKALVRLSEGDVAGCDTRVVCEGTLCAHRSWWRERLNFHPALRMTWQAPLPEGDNLGSVINSLIKKSHCSNLSSAKDAILTALEEARPRSFAGILDYRYGLELLEDGRWHGEMASVLVRPGTWLCAASNSADASESPCRLVGRTTVPNGEAATFDPLLSRHLGAGGAGMGCIAGAHDFPPLVANRAYRLFAWDGGMKLRPVLVKATPETIGKITENVLKAKGCPTKDLPANATCQTFCDNVSPELFVDIVVNGMPRKVPVGTNFRSVLESLSPNVADGLTSCMSGPGEIRWRYRHASLQRRYDGDLTPVRINTAEDCAGFELPLLPGDVIQW
jgi:hypothetical protein